MKKLIILVWGICVTGLSMAQQEVQIPLPDHFSTDYPRLQSFSQNELQSKLGSGSREGQIVEGLHERIDPYIDQYKQDPEWMVSRLQMYWSSKATKVYIDGINYAYAEGEAPVPTVRFSGSRDPVTPFGRPKLEDVLPYMDDERGLYFHNRAKEGNPLEWVQQSKTGKGIESINQEIIGYARDAAFLYWLEENETYAQFSFELFDTYMAGMYYREEPIDISNSHIQTLVGLSSFQVIHENILVDLSELYDYLHGYIREKHPQNITNYEATFKKWADLIIQNGVPQNNWNLHQAKIILKVAMILQDDQNYKDKKGRQYYIDYLLNQTSARQWSLTKFLSYGYDPENGVWAECPSYSMGVTKDLTHFYRDFYKSLDFNILPYTPTIRKAVEMLPQYLFPNGQITAFGDSYYGPVDTQPMADLIWIAQQSGDADLEKEFTGMYRLFEPNAGATKSEKRPRPSIASFTEGSALELNPAYPAAGMDEYISQTFYAPNISWHVQRTGMDKENDLMVSLSGSLGNHMHANGINMELYGKGFVLGAESGRGSSYFQPDYLEYYSQFPAHNTVMVDGISSYPVMLSNHAYDLIAEYPASGQKTGFYQDLTFAEVYFLEPESRSDQQRLVSIIKTSESSGYYLDIFRSRKQRNGDKYHDYFYHNLGQTLEILGIDEQPLALKPSEEMAFAGGHLFALDYQWDKQSVKTNADYQARWKVDFPENEEDIYMNLWMKGMEGREVFSLKSPATTAFKKGHDFPYDVSHSPYLTLAARQHGEAWDHPFISVYEPYTSTQGSAIASISGFEDENGASDFVGVQVQHKSGRVDYHFSSHDHKTAKYQEMTSNGDFAMVADKGTEDWVLFLGNGSLLSALGLEIKTEEPGNVLLEKVAGKYYLHNEVSISLRINSKTYQFEAGGYQEIKF